MLAGEALKFVRREILVAKVAAGRELASHQCQPRRAEPRSPSSHGPVLVVPRAGQARVICTYFVGRVFTVAGQIRSLVD